MASESSITSNSTSLQPGASDRDKAAASASHAATKFASALDRFYFPLDADAFCTGILNVAKGLSEPHALSADAFASNLAGAISVAAMPYRMAASAVQQRIFQAVHSAQRIRSLKPEYERMSEQEREQWAFETAKEKFAEEEKQNELKAKVSPPGPFAEAVLLDLVASLRDAAFSELADELLRQSTILCWGALEVLVSDTFVAMVNSKPDIAGSLFRDARTRKYYQARDFGAALEEHNYDLSSCMGEVLIDQHRLDDVESIRNALDVLFPSSSSLRTVLCHDKLWRFSQDRNLIVHRRGLIDRQYVAQTGSDCGLGTRLRIRPRLFEEYLTYVQLVGIEMLGALRISRRGADSE